MSEFKHAVSYYKNIVTHAKQARTREGVPPKSGTVTVSDTYSLKQKSKELTKARVQVVMAHHGEVLRALKNR